MSTATTACAVLAKLDPVGGGGRPRPVRQEGNVIIIGRTAVSEVLATPEVSVRLVQVARSARGEAIDELLEAAHAQDVPVQSVADGRIDRLAGDDRRHQGVVAEVDPPPPQAVDAWCEARSGRTWATQVLVLDHVHNPANVGMILRTAAGAGIDAVVLPRLGTASMGPLVAKAGSGVVFRVPLLDAPDVAVALDELQAQGFELYGLDGDGHALWDHPVADRAAWVLGNETVGMSEQAWTRIDATVAVPLDNQVESLNVASAAAVVAFELARRRRA